MHLLSLKNAFRARLPSKLHRQLLHQHHLQPHLQWGNDPRVANHNGIPSATHPPAPLAIPFTLRERSYSCKSQWNSVDRTCTKNTWNPIYNAEPIRPWSENIRPWSDHTRDRLAPVAPQRWIIGVRGRTLYGKTQGLVHLLSLKNAFRARLPSKLHRQLFPSLTLSLTNSFPDELFLWLTLSLTNSFPR